MGLSFALRLAARSLLQDKWINILSILTIASGLLFSALTILSVYNIDVSTRALPEKFSVMLYLKDNVSRQEAENIISNVKKENSIEKVKYIPKEEAMKELKTTLKDTDYILDGLGENPLPDSIEIKLKSEAINPDSVKKLADRLKDMQGVQEIEYGEKFLSSIYSLRAGVNTIGISFVIMLTAGMLFVCYSTVKILFYRKYSEIETYKLLGATRGFIMAPFVLEGAVIGLSSGLLSLIGILSLYYLVILKMSLTFPLFKNIIYPLDLSLALPLAGLVLGITGAVIAIGRIKY